MMTPVMLIAHLLYLLWMTENKYLCVFAFRQKERKIKVRIKESEANNKSGYKRSSVRGTWSFLMAILLQL